MKLKLPFLIFLALFLIYPARALAQEDTMILPIASESALPSSAPMPTEISYQLPYPGILPNSPVYPLKVLRDRLVEFFISDPLKRGDFYVLEGDKHIYAAMLLTQKSAKNYDLAETTVSKGENYMERALHEVSIAKERQENSKDLTSHISISLQKHQEEILKLKANAPEEVKSKLQKDHDRALKLQQSADALIPKGQ